jgi:hypothetical protein
MIRRFANNYTRRASRAAFTVMQLAIVLSLMMSVPALFGAENTGTVSQPLVGGSLVSTYMQEELGLLTLNRGCSASLLTNEWAITAAHCLEVTIGKPPTVAPATVTLTANWSTVQKQTAAQINTFRTLGYDVAIVRVVKPFVVLKSTSGYKRLALDAAPENLQNYKIEMYGRGINQFAKGSGPTATPSISDNQYRVGVASIGRYENNLNWLAYMTASVAGGDSGGPSFTTIYAGRVLTGVHALCTIRCLPGRTCGTWTGSSPAPAGYNPWSWVAATPECADAPVRPVWESIWQIINTSPKAPPSPLVTADRIEKDLHLYQAPQYVGQFDNKYYTKQFLYAVKANGDLMWYAHVIGIDRNPPRDPSVKEKAPTSAEQVTKPSGAAATMATKMLGGVTQGAKSSVTAKVAQVAQAPTPRIFHQWEGPRQVGNGW